MSAVDNFLDQFPGLDGFLKSIGGTTDERLGLNQVTVRLLAACAVGWIIGRIYRRTFTGKKFTPSLPDTHMLLALGGALIWVIVGDNMARAFGLAGTIGLIRYRTIVRDPKDTTILLFSMVMGMACGLGQYPVVIVGTVVIMLTLVWLHYQNSRTRAIEARKANNLLDLMKGGEGDDD